jgi:D-alanine-D-alanine ligase
MLKIGILYSESKFTPWRENIDTETLISLYRALPKNAVGTIIHMTEPNKDMADLLKRYNLIINVCYGFDSYNQADIATWLDENNITHLSSGGAQQQKAQDKLWVEQLLLESGLFVPVSLQNTNNLHHNLYISKPRFGGCHRGIEIFTAEEVQVHFQKCSAENKLIQPYLIGREFSIAIIPNENGTQYEALPPLEVIPFPKRDIYLAGQSHGKTRKSYFPNIDSEMLNSLCDAAVSAHNALDLKFMSRVDVRWVNNTPYILDVNTMPNLHPRKSMLPGLLKVHKIGLATLLKRSIVMATNATPLLSVH